MESGAADAKLQDGNVVSTLIAIYMRDLDGSSCEGRRTHDEGILRCATCKITRHQQGQPTIPPTVRPGRSGRLGLVPRQAGVHCPKRSPALQLTYVPASGSPDRP